jgi:hypothetical protein
MSLTIGVVAAFCIRITFSSGTGVELLPGIMAMRSPVDGSVNIQGPPPEFEVPISTSDKVAAKLKLAPS